MRFPAICPWNTVGAIAPIDAIERAVKFYRKAKTEAEKRAALTLIKQLASDAESHVDNFPPSLRRAGIPPRPEGV